MKKFLSIVLALTVVFTTAFALTGCNEIVDKVDSQKTQLYIGNYNGGVGEKWLDNAVTRFEAAYANTSFEAGKTGVQIIVDHNKSYDGINLPNAMPTDEKNDMYFTGGGNYFDIVGLGVVHELTDIVTKKTIPGETGTIASKMDSELLETFKVGGKIYAIPHYELYEGPSYDANLFEMNALFFIDEIDTNDTKYPGTRKFMLSQTHAAKRSCGPDGIYDTYDDGLPSSVHEFYKLMEKMRSKNIRPFVWTGDSPHYANQVLRNLYASLGGPELLDATYFMDSKGVPIEYVDGFDSNNRPIIKEAVITKDNAYLVKQSAALYYVLEFAQFVRSDDRFISPVGFGLDHISTQEEFVFSGKTYNGKDSIAMIIDGSWWWNEANDAGIFDLFEEMYPDTYSQKEFRVMTMPVQYDGTVTEGNGKAPTIAVGNSSMLIVNKNIDAEHIKVMEEFVTYIYSNTELLEFTKDTNGVLKGGINYNYSTIMNQLNSFAQSSLEKLNAAKEAGAYKSTFSANKIFLNNTPVFSIGNNDWLSANGHRFLIADFDTNTTLAEVREMFNKYKITPQVWATQYNIYG